MTQDNQNNPPPSADRKQRSYSATLRLRLSRADVWELMWRPESQADWLGSTSTVRLERGARWLLSDEAGPWRIARPIRIKSTSSVTLMIKPAASWQSDEESRATIRIDDFQESGSIVSVEEVNVPHSALGDVEQYWSRRIQQLRALVGRIQQRRQSVRQALVVIHGIGEQQPGDTLSSLVESGVLSSTKDEGMWVKPDRVSGSYELRSVTVKGSGQRPTTEVFEFYWAHIIRDTKLGQVVAWLRQLLLRWHVPPPLRLLWSLGWMLILAVVVFGAAKLIGAQWPARWLANSAIIVVLATLLWRFLGQALAINLLGDAARYLSPHPANVAHRQAIRKAGIDLIKKLHTTGRYDRIVILGHSLGSVIAYDIITHAWTEMHASHRKPVTPSFKQIVDIERNLRVADPIAAQKLQRDAWHCIRLNTQPWLITDLVTVGSPLTYADFLMAAGPDDFKQAIANRVVPTCPPESEVENKSQHHRVSYDYPYHDVTDGRARTFTQFHHGAPFAVTRWTNLYFKTRRFGTCGDLVGGAVANHFGKWVKDVPLESPTRGVAHTWYWRRTGKNDDHLEALRKALNLDVRDELLDHLELMPAFALRKAKRKSF